MTRLHRLAKTFSRFGVQATTALVAALLALNGGCKSNPYSLRLTDIDESQHDIEQRDSFARFAIRDAQIYERETLINDRRRERAYLEQALDNSATATFTPQLARELTQISALTADLGIAFDPAKGLAFRNAAQTAGLQQEVDAAKLNLELLDLRKRMELLASGAREPGTDAVTSPAPATLTGLAPTPPSTERLFARLNDQISKVLDLLKADIPLPKSTLLSANPDETYQDRKAFRERIRADLAETNLDDMHDVDGNSLFRFQFNLTVAPGEKPAKYGLARFTVQPPSMTTDEVKALYYGWLRHLTYRLNETAADDGEGPLPDRRLQLLAASSRLFDIARLHVVPDNNDLVVYLATPPGASRRLELLFQGGIDILLRERLTRTLTAPPPTTPGPPARPPGSTWPLVIRLLDRYLTSRPPTGDVDWTDVAQAILCTHELWRARAQLGQFGGALAQVKLDDESCTDSSSSTGEVPKPKGSKPDVSKSHGSKPNVSKSQGSKPDASNPEVAKSENSNTGTSKVKAPPRTVPEQKVFTLSTAAKAYTQALRDLSGPGLTIPAGTPSAHRRAIQETLAARIRKAAVTEARLLDLLLIYADQPAIEALLPAAVAQEFAEMLDRDAAVIAATGAGALGRRDLVHDARLRALSRVEQFQSAVQIAREYLAAAPSPKPGPAAAEIPPLFIKMLFIQQGSTLIPKGSSYVYAVAPAEKAQLVSSVANAAQSIQLALAAAGMIPNAGLSAEAGFGYAHSAVGKVQALERIPAIVGFADRSKAVAGHIPGSSAQFGWVIGPKVRLDPRKNKLVLEQSLANYAVSADIVLPGWWPSIDFVSQNAWIGHWHALPGSRARADGKEDVPLIEEGVSSVRFRQVKPINRADYDALTSQISQVISNRPLQLTRIYHVEPPSLSLCNDKEVTFQIYGANLWRGSQANLMGLGTPTRIDVLPDMEGVAVTFRLDSLKGRYIPHGDRRLTIWTRDGYDSTSISVTGELKTAGCEDTWAEPTPRPTGPRIAAVTPAVLSVCQESPTLTIETLEIAQASTDVVVATLAAEKGRIDSETYGPKDGEEGKDGLVLRVSFDKPVKDIAQGLTELPLLLVNTNGKTAAATVKVAGDPKACNAVVHPSPVEVSISSALADGRDRVLGCGGRVIVQVNGANLDKVTSGELLGVSAAPMAGKTAKAISFAFDLPRFGRSVPLPPQTVLRAMDDAGKVSAVYRFPTAECSRQP